MFIRSTLSQLSISKCNTRSTQLQGLKQWRVREKKKRLDNNNHACKVVNNAQMWITLMALHQNGPSCERTMVWQKKTENIFIPKYVQIFLPINFTL